jgi:hypothetical protein
MRRQVAVRAWIANIRARDDNLERFEVFRTEAEALAWLNVEKG